jgi:hypothetical protein
VLGRSVVEVEDLLIVLGLPMDEHADDETHFVGLAAADDTFGDGVNDGAGDRRLSGSEELQWLLFALYGDLCW